MHPSVGELQVVDRRQRCQHQTFWGADLSVNWKLQESCKSKCYGWNLSMQNHFESKHMFSQSASCFQLTFEVYGFWNVYQSAQCFKVAFKVQGASEWASYFQCQSQMTFKVALKVTLSKWLSSVCGSQSVSFSKWNWKRLWVTMNAARMHIMRWSCLVHGSQIWWLCCRSIRRPSQGVASGPIFSPWQCIVAKQVLANHTFLQRDRTEVKKVLQSLFTWKSHSKCELWWVHVFLLKLFRGALSKGFLKVFSPSAFSKCSLKVFPQSVPVAPQSA